MAAAERDAWPCPITSDVGDGLDWPRTLSLVRVLLRCTIITDPGLQLAPMHASRFRCTMIRKPLAKLLTLLRASFVADTDCGLDILGIHI